MSARTVQAGELRRVRGKLDDLVLGFLAGLRGHPRTFTGPALSDWVRARVDCSPASPDRVLRALAASGRCEYRLVSRAGSRYELVWIEGDQPMLDL